MYNSQRQLQDGKFMAIYGSPNASERHTNIEASHGKDPSPRHAFIMDLTLLRDGSRKGHSVFWSMF